ncbi:MAG: hypothetical protein ACLFVE_15455, partial [Chitinispirillaceae bacterium]
MGESIADSETSDPAARLEEIEKRYWNCATDIDTRFERASKLCKQTTDEFQRDCLQVLLANESPETSFTSGTGSFIGIMRNIISKYENRAGFESVLALARCSLATVVSYCKGDYLKSQNQLKLALENCRTIGSPGKLHVKLRFALAFTYLYSHEFERADRELGILRKLAENDFHTSQIHAAEGYGLLLKYYCRGLCPQYALRAYHSFDAAERLLKRAGKEAFRSWLEHVRLYKAICHLVRGENVKASGLFSSLRNASHPLTRLFSIPGMILCSSRTAKEKRVVTDLLDRWDDELNRRGVQGPPKLYRAPLLFNLYFDAVVMNRESSGFRETENLLRKAAEPYKRYMSRRILNSGDSDKGFANIDVAQPVCMSISRLLNFYLDMPSGQRNHAHVLYAMDKSRYPFVRLHRPDEGSVAGAEKIIEAVEKESGTALISLVADTVRRTVAHWLACGDVKESGRTGGLGIREVFCGLMEKIKLLGVKKILALVKDEIEYPLHVWAGEWLGGDVAFHYGTSQERLWRWLGTETPDVKGIHLHLPAPSYRDALPFPNDELVENARCVCAQRGLRCGDDCITSGVLTLKDLFSNSYPLVVVGHGCEVGGEPGIDFGSGQLSMRQVAAWPPASVRNRSLLFFSCGGGRCHTAPGTLLNIPSVFLDREGYSA